MLFPSRLAFAAPIALVAACRTETPTPTAPPVLTPSTSASVTEPPSVAIEVDAAAVVAEPTPTTAADASDATTSRWCMKSEYSEVNGVKRAPFVLSGAEAATRLASSAYSKRILPGKNAYLVEAYGCPDPVRCKAAATVTERRDACDYVLRLYLYDPAPPAGGRGVFYVDIDDHVDATTGELWRNEGAGWRSERM